jgi:hypothetical protein
MPCSPAEVGRDVVEQVGACDFSVSTGDHAMPSMDVGSKTLLLQENTSRRLRKKQRCEWGTNEVLYEHSTVPTYVATEVHSHMVEAFAKRGSQDPARVQELQLGCVEKPHDNIPELAGAKGASSSTQADHVVAGVLRGTEDVEAVVPMTGSVNVTTYLPGVASSVCGIAARNEVSIIVPSNDSYMILSHSEKISENVDSAEACLRNIGNTC